MADSVKNVIDPATTGYIRKERLEARLRDLFGVNISVRVGCFSHVSTRPYLTVNTGLLIAY